MLLEDDSDIQSPDSNGGEDETVRDGVIAVIRRGDRYLTITRSQAVIAPGKICFPGGGIEPGETAQGALIRECREELGVDVEPGEELGVTVTPWKVRLRWFYASFTGDAELRPDPREVEAFHWMTIEEMLVHPDLLESNRPFLERLSNQYSV